MLKLKMILMLFGTALIAQAQQVTLVTPSSMQFSDPTYGVAFRYPAKWNFSTGNEFYLPVTITSEDVPARGIVYFSSDGGYNPYPQTNLSGAEFIYTNRQTASADECLKLALQGDGNAKMSGPKKINGISYVHAQTGSAGMCHQISEDIYATSRGATCYLFDLAVQTLCAGVVDNTRAITSNELTQVYASLEKILSSVEIKDLKN